MSVYDEIKKTIEEFKGRKYISSEQVFYCTEKTYNENVLKDYPNLLCYITDKGYKIRNGFKVK